MSGEPETPSIDALLDAYVAAWNAGDAPSADDYTQRAAPADRDELAGLIADYLLIAPTVAPTADATSRLEQDPLLARLAALEAPAPAPAPAAEPAPDAQAATTWGERLREFREAAGLSITALAAGFSDAFALSPADRERAPEVLASLERSELPAQRVAARAAHALERLVRAQAGALLDGVSPALADPVLRGSLPETGEERQALFGLLRDVDDAIARAQSPAAPDVDRSEGAEGDEDDDERGSASPSASRAAVDGNASSGPPEQGGETLDDLLGA